LNHLIVSNLYRSVYSFNEKSGLVSIPLNPEKVMDFKKNDAIPENVKVDYVFLDQSKSDTSDSIALFTQAFDFKPELPEDENNTAKKMYKDFETIEEAIPMDFFPPCMQNILKGLKDGKKRALFIMINFLLDCGWGHEEIEALILEWNKKNPDPLKENILRGQLRYRKVQKKKILPPNCVNSIYKDIQVCIPDNFCQRVKNPLNYAIRKKKVTKKAKKKTKKSNRS